MSYSDATESADGLESASDKQLVDKLANTTPITTSGLSMSPQSGSFGSASYNVTYLELPDHLIFMSALVRVSSIGSATGTLSLGLPVSIANASNGTAGVDVRAYDYGTSLGLDVASVCPNQLRVLTTSGSGNAFVNNSYIAFQCLYQGAS